MGYLDGRVTLRSNVVGQKIKGVVKEAGWQRIYPGDFAISGMNAHLGGMGICGAVDLTGSLVRGHCGKGKRRIERRGDLQQGFVGSLAPEEEREPRREFEIAQRQGSVRLPPSLRFGETRRSLGGGGQADRESDRAPSIRRAGRCRRGERSADARTLARW